MLRKGGKMHVRVAKEQRGWWFSKRTKEAITRERRSRGNDARNTMPAHPASADMALGSRPSGVLPFHGRGADALVAREGGPPTALAGKDDAFAGFAADADRAANPGAVVAFPGRGAAAARVESFGGVDALVCRRSLESQSMMVLNEPFCVSFRGLTTAVAGHDPRDFSLQLEVVLDGFVICSAGGAKSRRQLEQIDMI